MDIRRHLEVLRRWRLLVIVGALFGIALAVLASFQISTSGLRWRTPVSYQSSSVLLVTQAGFPWGRAVVPLADGTDTTRTSSAIKAAGPQFADPSRYIALATIYSFMVHSQPVLNLIPSKPLPEQVAAQPFKDGSNNGSPLPLIGMTTTAVGSPQAAVKLNRDAIDALRTYVRQQQDATQTPARERAVIQIYNPPAPAVVSQGHKLTKSILALILCLGASMMLAYVLENLRMAKQEPGPSWMADGEAVLDAGPARDARVLPAEQDSPQRLRHLG